MTILIDTKNEMKTSIAGLDGRVSELDRELRGGRSPMRSASCGTTASRI
ncbi:hypothetical protein [Streptomyces sp. NBC_01618]|nr:hypothetical protein OH735_15390 [Streptomyces sp. NBC_01618]